MKNKKVFWVVVSLTVLNTVLLVGVLLMFSSTTDTPEPAIAVDTSSKTHVEDSKNKTLNRSIYWMNQEFGNKANWQWDYKNDGQGAPHYLATIPSAEGIVVQAFGDANNLQSVIIYISPNKKQEDQFFGHVLGAGLVAGSIVGHDAEASGEWLGLILKDMQDDRDYSKRHLIGSHGKASLSALAGNLMIIVSPLDE